MLNVTAKWRWNSVERAAWDADIAEGRVCPECNWGSLRWSPLVPPHHNPERTNPNRSKSGAVIFNRVHCTAYGQCELAPG